MKLTLFYKLTQKIGAAFNADVFIIYLEAFVMHQRDLYKNEMAIVSRST